MTETVQSPAATAPDVVLMDIQMPDMNGIEATRRIPADHPAVGVIMLTMLEDDSLFTAMRAGARGYILKGADKAEVLALIARGLSNSDIAGRLHISGKTVSNHVSSIFNKLQVVDRAQAIVKARDAHVGDT